MYVSKWCTTSRKKELLRSVFFANKIFCAELQETFRSIAPIYVFLQAKKVSK